MELEFQIRKPYAFQVNLPCSLPSAAVSIPKSSQAGQLWLFHFSSTETVLPVWKPEIFKKI